MRKLIGIFLLIVSLNINAQSITTVDTSVLGWTAIITYPDDYFTNTDRYYPLLCFFPGAGEAGGSHAQLRTYGPHAYIANGGWDGTVTLGNGIHKFIVVSLSQSPTYDINSNARARLNVLLSFLRVKTDGVVICGLSAGGHCAGTMVTEDNFDNVAPYGPFTYADGISAMFSAQGVQPDDNSDFINKFKNFARNNRSGRYLGIWGSADGSRYIPEIAASMNAAVANSAVVVNTADAHNNVAFNKYFGNSSAPLTYSIDGITQTPYQWLARQTDTTQYVAGALSVNAGNDQNIQLPIDTARLTGTVSGGTSPYTYLWTKISGSGTQSILSNTTLSPKITGLVSNSYVFRLTATDNIGTVVTDDVQINMLEQCNGLPPVVYNLNNTGSAGEIYRPNGSSWKGGDTIKITGTSYSVIEFYNVHGDICRPIVIKAATNLVTNAFRIKGNCSYLKIIADTMRVADTLTRTFRVAGTPISVQQSHHIEVNGLEAHGGSTGVYAKSDAAYSDTMTWYPNYLMSNLTFTNLWVHHIDGEGFYAGVTDQNGRHVTSTWSGLDTVIIPTRLDSITISYCIVQKTKWDGIQLSSARNGNKIFNNLVEDFGLANESGQQCGIILGGNSNGNVYNNTIRRGTGNGIQFFGYGTANIYGNFIDSAGFSGRIQSLVVVGDQAIYCNDNLNTVEVNPAHNVNIYNNTIYHQQVCEAIRVSNNNGTSSPSSVHNNTFKLTAGSLVSWETSRILVSPGGSTVYSNTLLGDAPAGNTIRGFFKIAN